MIVRYTFESVLTIHEIKALYGAVGWDHYLDDPAVTARGIAHSTLLTARDEDGNLVGLIRGVSDMHTIVLIQDLVVHPDYQHQGIGRELLTRFDEYFKQVTRIIIICDHPELAAFYAEAGFEPSVNTDLKTYIRPRKLLEPRY